MARIRFLPEDKLVEVRDGVSILEAARRSRVNIRTRCGGVAGCLMCKISLIEADPLPPPTGNEEKKLGTLIDQGIRLACQTRCKGSMTIMVPEDPLKAAVRAQLAKQKEEQDGI